ncbi:GNAT family N-acetyltransferase [Archangium lansingense]|uniref:GNAT family N-acetyltransferase n=1 Tax=Archangium lansingense TaxID=2995310 RepID=A0ABT3ZXK5_9BACT|nr:GNAT family N-acetyltransferase [Archangium lansinium]MCY1074129.1 GNAT family N-acetyltransferase [Archangium lansinium]
MDSAFRQQFLELDLALARRFASVEARPWGYFVHDVGNPDHWDANTARWLRAEAPEAAIEEVVALYRARRLTSRVRLDDLSAPGDMVERLMARGFQTDTQHLRLMHWAPGPSRPHPVLFSGLTLEVAGPETIGAMAEILGAANIWEGREWLVRYLDRLVPHPASHYYLARVEGVPAAVAALHEGVGCALVQEVATHPSYRRRGLATALITWLQRRATTPLFLQVSNPEAECIYARAGFRVWAEIEQAACRLPEP